MNLEQALAKLLEDDPAMLIPIVAVPILFGGGFLTVILTCFLSTVASVARNRELERSRREIAAYVSEGSLSTEDGERLLSAGQRPRKRC